MAETAKPPRRRRRGIVFALLVLAALFGAGAIALRHYSRPQTLTALLVDQVRSSLGAELKLEGLGRFEFSPGLRLVLPRPALHAPDTAGPLLSAQSLDVSVPWHTLWGDRLDIERIDIERPVLDADAFSAWLAKQPPGAATPDVRFALRVRDGRVIAGGKPVAEGVNLDFANADDLAAWLAKLRSGDPAVALVPPLRGTAQAASVTAGGVRIEGVRVDVTDDAPVEPAKQ